LKKSPRALRNANFRLPNCSISRATGSKSRAWPLPKNPRNSSSSETGSHGRFAGVGPGGQAHYQEIREDLDAAVEIAFTLLDDPELLRVAGCQFIWRCYEYYLEMSNDLDAVLDALSRAERVEHGKSLLLAECLINHYSSFAPMVAAIVVDNRATVEVLAKLGQSALEDIDYGSLAELSTFQRDHLASTVFENTLSSLCPPITSKTCGRYHRVLAEKADVIEAARRQKFRR